MKGLKASPRGYEMTSLVRLLPLAAALTFCGAVDARTVQRDGPHAPGEVPAGLNAADLASLRGQIEASRYRAAADGEGGYVAANPAHRWAVAYGPDGSTRITPRGSEAHEGRWSLRLSGYGHETLRSVDRPATVAADEETVTYTWDDTVAEWWLNTAAGLEQGFTVQRRPAGAGEAQPLRVQLAWSGNLVAAPAGAGVSFSDASGNPAFNYTGLRAWDARGQDLPARLTTAGKTFTLVIEDAAATYPLTIDPWIQQAYLKASNTDSGDFFGFSVAISGNTVVVGAYGEASSATGVNGAETDNSAPFAGAAYVFVRSGLTWIQQAYLKASNTGAGDWFGYSVAISGDTVVVGALGEASSATGVNGGQTDNSVPFAGAAYVFVRNGSTWSQQAYLKASNTGVAFQFGLTVAVFGDTAVVGAIAEHSNATGVNGDQTDNSTGLSGAAYVFVRSGSTWSQEAYLKASNTGADDRFGYSVAISGDTVVVGAIGEASNSTGVNGDQMDNSAKNSGAAYVFVRNGSIWSQQAYLKASNTEGGDEFGSSVAISGDIVVVGVGREASNATGVNGDQTDNSAELSGAAYVFVRSGSTWSQQAYLKASNTEANDVFGFSVAISGDTVVVGASLEDSNATGVNGDQTDNSAGGSGAAYVFVRSGSTWSQQTYLKASNTSSPGAGDEFGCSVMISGDTVVVGAFGEDSHATGVNSDQADNSATDSGAAYVFTVAQSAVEIPALGATGLAVLLLALAMAGLVGLRRRPGRS